MMKCTSHAPPLARDLRVCGSPAYVGSVSVGGGLGLTWEPLMHARAHATGD